MAEEGRPPALEHRVFRWNILWKYSIFEAGDSGWSLIVVSTYFGTFLQVVLREPGSHIGWAVTAGALITAVASPVLGAATWSTILTIFGERILGYDLAVAALALYVIFGAALISIVPDVRPASSNFVQPT